MKYDVFISYSSLDQKAAEGVCAYLEQHRIRCFIAYRDIPRGVEWAEVIPQALLECRVMVIIFSDNFNASEEVNREITIAVKSKKIILPFRISDDDFKGLKLYYLCGLNWIDAFPNPEKSFGSLCENVRKLLGMEEAGEPAPGRQPESSLEPTDPEEQCNLGRRYETGDGVPKDAEKAVYWYRKAAEQGYAAAQNNLGVCYQFGSGVERDHGQAVYWYRKAAEQGNAAAQNNLGYCYSSGYGVPKDAEKTVYWYRKAAEQGYADAQNSLGSCYENGNGVLEDSQQAVYWYRKAAEQGYAFAQYNLGYCYQYGIGVTEDIQQAVNWYRKAALNGEEWAQSQLNELGETW